MIPWQDGGFLPLLEIADMANCIVHNTFSQLGIATGGQRVSPASANGLPAYFYGIHSFHEFATTNHPTRINQIIDIKNYIPNLRLQHDIKPIFTEPGTEAESYR